MEQDVKRLLRQTVMDRHLLDELTEQGLLTPPQRQSALAALHPGYQWGQWAFSLLLGGGAALILSGIIFFFAFNWDALSSLAKLSLPQLGMVLAAGLAWWRGRETITGRASLLAASVMIGVFMAVFGQVYQTGADAWQLFAGWAVLMLPWLVLSRFAIHWAVWLIVANLALWLWWQQVYANLADTELYALLSMASLNGLLLIARECLAYRHEEAGWMTSDWIRWALVTALIGLLSPIALSWLADLGLTDQALWSGVLATLLLTTIGFVYRYRLPDLPSLAMLALALCLILIVTVGSHLDGWGMGSIGVTFFSGSLALVSFSLVAGYLRQLKSQWLEAGHDV